MEKDDPGFFASHVGMDRDNIDTRFAEGFERGLQFVFSYGEIAINYCVLVAAGKCRPCVHSHGVVDINTVNSGRTAESEFDHSLVSFTTTMKDPV